MNYGRAELPARAIIVYLAALGVESISSSEAVHPVGQSAVLRREFRVRFSKRGLTLEKTDA